MYKYPNNVNMCVRIYLCTSIYMCNLYIYISYICICIYLSTCIYDIGIYAYIYIIHIYVYIEIYVDICMNENIQVTIKILRYNIIKLRGFS